MSLENSDCLKIQKLCDFALLKKDRPFKGLQRYKDLSAAIIEKEKFAKFSVDFGTYEGFTQNKEMSKFNMEKCVLENPYHH